MKGDSEDFRRRCEALFMELLPLEPAQRVERLAELRADDNDLRAEVESLLGHHDDARGMLDCPAPFSFGGAALQGAGGDDAALPPMCEAGGYRLRSVLGSGGMGVVYVAQQLSTRRTVAVKLIRHGHASATIARRFEHEAAILAKLHHAGIAQIFEAGVADFGRGAQPFIAMELVDGTTLTDHADARGLGTRRRMELMARVCDAVHHAHQRGVIHRDLKPANILVVADASVGQPKILDFGVARATDSELQVTTVRTSVGQLIGTLPYMSPEQVSGDPAEIDIRSDVYALGVLLFRILAGRLPHDLATRSIAEAARIIRDEPPARMSSINRLFRGDIESIVAKALEKEKERRYASAADLAADVRRSLANEPIAARPATARYQMQQFVRRNKALSSVIAALFIVIAAGIITTLAFAFNAKHAEGVAKTAQEAAELDSREARAQTAIARRKAYVANIAAATAATALQEMVVARRSLDAVDPSDRVHWEWRHLDAMQDGALSVLRAPSSAVYSVAYSPDGSLLASASYDGCVRVWDMRTEQAIAVLKGHEKPVYSVAFSPDGTHVASGATDATVRVWDLASQSQQCLCAGHTAIVHSVSFSPDGATLASCSEDGTVRCWNATTGAPLPELTKLAVSMRSVAFSPGGDQIAAGGDDGFIRVWDLADREPVGAWRGHAGVVADIAYSADGGQLASVGSDQMARVWSTETWREVLAIDTESGPLRSVTFSPDGSQLATGSAEMTVRLWNARTGRRFAVLNGHGGVVMSLAWSPDGTRLASAGAEQLGSIRIWDPATAGAAELLEGHVRSVAGLAFSPDATTLISLGNDRHVRAWDAASGLPLAALSFPLVDRSLEPFAYRIRTDGQRLMIVGDDATLRIVDLATWSDERTLELGEVPSAPMALAITADGSRLAVGTMHGVTRLLDATSGAEIGVFIGQSARIGAVAFSRDGAFLASSDAAGVVRLWRLADGELIATMEGHTRPVQALDFSPDGSVVVSAGGSEDVRLWNGRTGAALCVLARHVGGSRSVAFSPDGRRLATGSGDGLVRIWDPAVGEELSTLRVSGFPASSLAFSPDGTTLAVGTEDRKIRLFRTTPAGDRARARAELSAIAQRLNESFADGRGTAGRSAMFVMEVLREINTRADLPPLQRRAAMHAAYRAAHPAVRANE